MKPLSITASIILTLAFTVLPARGSTFPVGIFIDTSPLIGQGSFNLDFELLDGSSAGDANNTATIQAIYFSGGEPPFYQGEAPVFGITLTDTAVFNQFLQPLPSDTFGASMAFSTTTELDSGGTADQFSIKILDWSGTPIPTVGPDDAFLILKIDSANPIFQTFRSDLGRTAIDIAAPTVDPDAIPVPESVVPTTLVAALIIHSDARREGIDDPTKDKGDERLPAMAR
jgi:hypothetical protein